MSVLWLKLLGAAVAAILLTLVEVKVFAWMRKRYRAYRSDEDATYISDIGRYRH